jgi:hypothetical protein
MSQQIPGFGSLGMYGVQMMLKWTTGRAGTLYSVRLWFTERDMISDCVDFRVLQCLVMKQVSQFLGQKALNAIMKSDIYFGISIEGDYRK